jgi:branched-chain amino acid aminotransferase
MANFIYNGKIYTEKTTIIEADNRGLRYGDGLFETIKIIKGKMVLQNEHFARLWKGMQVLQFTIPKHFTPEKLQEEILLLVKKNEHEDAARVRITLFRSNGGLYDAIDNFPNYTIQTWALPQGNGVLNSNGLDIGIYADVKKNCDIVSNLKHNNYLPYVMAALYAKKQKWNDAIVLNNFGRICDTTIANIFFIKDEVVYTTALTEGCVAGVMRKYICDNITTAGLTCIQKQISIEELMVADEIFLTNSIYDIRWVKSCDNSNFTCRLTQKIYTAMVSTIL